MQRVTRSDGPHFMRHLSSWRIPTIFSFLLVSRRHPRPTLHRLELSKLGQRSMVKTDLNSEHISSHFEVAWDDHRSHLFAKTRPSGWPTLPTNPCKALQGHCVGEAEFLVRNGAHAVRSVSVFMPVRHGGGPKRSHSAFVPRPRHGQARPSTPSHLRSSPATPPARAASPVAPNTRGRVRPSPAARWIPGPGGEAGPGGKARPGGKAGPGACMLPKHARRGVRRVKRGRQLRERARASGRHGRARVRAHRGGGNLFTAEMALPP